MDDTTLTEQARAAARAAGTVALALAESIRERDPAMHADFERAQEAGAVAELAIRFGIDGCEFALNLRGPTGKTCTVATMHSSGSQLKH